jgi:hypothetical protein
VSRGTGEGQWEEDERLMTATANYFLLRDDSPRACGDVLAALGRWREDRESVAALTAEVQRLRGVIRQDAIRFRILADRARGCVKGEISEGHPLSVKEGDWWADDCLAALTPPAADTEGKDG